MSIGKVAATVALFTLAVGCVADPPPFMNETTSDSSVPVNDGRTPGVLDGANGRDIGTETNMDAGIANPFDSSIATDAAVSMDSHVRLDQMVRPVRDAAPDNDANVEPSPWQTPYSEVHFAATHDSFNASNRGTLGAQLARGIRSFEFSFFAFGDTGNGMNGRWPIGEDEPGDGVSYGDGANDNPLTNPSNNRLDSWLERIELWSQNNPLHAPITIFLRPQTNLAEISSAAAGNLSGLNETIINIFGRDQPDALYRKSHKANGPWPTVGELRGKVIIVLSAGRDTLDYVRQVGADVRAGDGDEHDSGHPTIALDGQNDVQRALLVYEGSDGRLVYWSGRYNRNTGRVSWRISGRLEAGHRPAVMFLNNRFAVLVYDRDDEVFWQFADFSNQINRLQPSWSNEEKVHGGHSPRLSRIPNDMAQRVRCVWRHNTHYDDDFFSLRNDMPVRRGKAMTPDINNADNTVSGPLRASVGANGVIQTQNGNGMPTPVRLPAVMFVDAEQQQFGEDFSAIDDVLNIADFVTANAPEADDDDFGEPFRFAERGQPNVVRRLRQVREENNVVPAQAQHVATEEVTSDWFNTYMSQLKAIDWRPGN